ncbi:hypothetical protein [Streptosporangium roseum]|uniref:hypothetical protein n=1 Tax=Streptosporangium roseum TaxID=2001 RepID=UPI00331DD7EF
MTTPALSLIQFNASRDEIIAHLDAHPEWQRTSADEAKIAWRLTLPPTDPYSSIYSGVQSVSVRLPTPGGMFERLGSHYVIDKCAEVAHIVNAVTLRMPRDTDWEIIERIVAAYQQLDPSSVAALILSGRLEGTSPDE